MLNCRADGGVSLPAMRRRGGAWLIVCWVAVGLELPGGLSVSLKNSVVINAQLELAYLSRFSPTARR